MNITTTRNKHTGTIAIKVAGHLIDSGTTRRDQARLAFHLAQKMAPDVHQFGLGKQLTITEAIAEWTSFLEATAPPATLYNKLTYVRAWAKEMDVEKDGVSQITEDKVDQWVNETSPIKVGTRRVRLSVLRSFFEFIMARRYAIYDPSKPVQIKTAKLRHQHKETAERIPFLDSEIILLTQYLSRVISKVESNTVPADSPRGITTERKLNTARFWLAALVIGRYTGLRLGSIANLEWASLMIDRIIVHTEKTHKRVALLYGQEILNPQAVREAIELIPKTDAVFCFPVQRSIYSGNSSRAKLSVQFSGVCRRAGLDGRCFHALRHTYIQECSKHGIPLKHIATAVGHTSVKTSEGYIHYETK